MRQSNQRHDSPNTSPAAAWLPGVAAAMVMIAGFLGTFLILQMGHMRPTVGDIVSFNPSPQTADTWRMSIPATIVARGGASAGTCTLDPSVLLTHGGSFVVEARLSTPLAYQVHWSGAQTGNAGEDCGRVADLRVSPVDLQRLANAAGGFGVLNKGVFR